MYLAKQRKKLKMQNRIIKTYKRNDLVKRKIDEKLLAARGYFPVEEEEIKQYSGGKGLVLGLIFLPLALLGHRSMIKVTYEKAAK